MLNFFRKPVSFANVVEPRTLRLYHETFFESDGRPSADWAAAQAAGEELAGSGLLVRAVEDKVENKRWWLTVEAAYSSQNEATALALLWERAFAEARAEGKRPAPGKFSWVPEAFTAAA